ncbi:MAG: hypothetical protein HXX16_05120 [Bacteroidales bacterium]|nr:hypothetical protein [Bacteroidales bacterium]
MASEASPWVMDCEFFFALKGQVKLGFQPVKNNIETLPQGIAIGYNSFPLQGAFNKTGNHIIQYRVKVMG